MALRLSRALLCAVVSSRLLYGQADDASRLPIQRVVLYKNGVGYFEHLGSVRGNQDVTISFTSGQLNDVLKSLTVLDLNGGRITGVGYGSATPADKQLGDLRLPVGEKASLTEFLGALRGAKIEVKSAGVTIAGRLLSVERKTRITGGNTLEVDYLSLIGENGELRTTELSPAFSVRLLERGLPEKVNRYLDLAATAREADVRRMVVSTEGTGERSLFVSYISEVPIWKATYRIVLNSKTGQKPLLQGWAIVDNTVGQDWEKVQMSLVAGAPQSFVQNLSQPYYSKRPVVPMPQSVTGTPQTFEATLTTGAARLAGTVTDPAGMVVAGVRVKAFDAGGSLLGETLTSGMGRYEFPSLPDGTVRVEMESPGFNRVAMEGVTVSSGRETRQDARLMIGGVAQTMDVTAASPSVQTESTSVAGGRSLGRGSGLGGQTFLLKRPVATPSVVLSAARNQAQSAANAQELGDLFEYKLKDPITIRKNRSALVPIAQSSIAAEKVSVWNDAAGLSRPQLALWLENSSGLTLDGGSFSVLEEETFAGEGVFEPIRKGEKRLVSYAVDLAVNASSKVESASHRVTRVRVSQGVMTHVSEVRESKTYTFRNEDSAPRTVIVEHPVRSGYQLKSETRPSETTAGWMRFRLPVAPKQTASLAVEEARPVEATYTLSTLRSEQVALFLKEKSINKAVEDRLRPILAQKAVVSDLESQISSREDQTQKIFDDQQRLRENMKALKGSAEEKGLLQRYTRELDAQETRLAAMQKESQQLEERKDRAQEQLDKMIEDLAFDVAL